MNDLESLAKVKDIARQISPDTKFVKKGDLYVPEEIKKPSLKKKSTFGKVKDFIVFLGTYLTLNSTPLFAQYGDVHDMFTGESIAGAQVECNGNTVNTDANGYFQFENSVNENPTIITPYKGDLEFGAYNILAQEIPGEFSVRDKKIIFTPDYNLASGMILLKAVGKDFFSTDKALMGDGNAIFYKDKLENKIETNGKGKGRSTSSLDQWSQLRIIANGYFPRITFTDSESQRMIHETLVDSSFNMEAFDQMARQERRINDRIVRGTSRVISPLDVYFVNGGNVYPNTEIPNSAHLDSAETILLNDINDIVYIINGITRGERPPVVYPNGYPNPPIRPDNLKHIVRWDDTVPGGGTNVAYLDSNNLNIIKSASTRLPTLSGEVARRAYMEELLQPYGLLNDTNVPEVRESIFYKPLEGGPSSLNDGYLSDFDIKSVIFLYSRSPGSLSPDTDQEDYVRIMSEGD